MPGVEVRVEGVEKAFQGKPALRGVTTVFPKGRITVILGPSGSGKTTLLRIIAGLEEPNAGRVFFDGVDVTGVPPERRGIGYVFQDLALFPHLNVYENIAFGLRVRGAPEGEVRRRVEWALELVGLDPREYAGRRIDQLSGGQRQRVAIARALVVDPRVLLLDEPFAHLDYKLKKRLLRELRRIHRESGSTIIYVTHDQEEAMEVADKLVIMNEGRIVQEGSPEEVYERPRNSFVASFYGEANIVEVNGRRLVVRPEKISLPPLDGEEYKYWGRVVDKVFLGPLVRVEVETEELGTLVVVAPRSARVPGPGERVQVGWREEDAREVPW